jgi:uncharacterized membrane protein
MLPRISLHEIVQAQIALFAAIILQIITLRISRNLLPESQYILIAAEIVLGILIAFTYELHHTKAKVIHHAAAVSLLALISVANFSALLYVLNSLIASSGYANGEKLLASAVTIFLTNIIVFALWYWEIDSPGLTRTRWSRHDHDFQFTQHDLKAEFAGWKPEFADFMYLSITNAINFAPADTRPLTHQAKMLMAAQSLISVFTLALVIARSVSILGA